MKKALKTILIIFVSALVFFIITMPFRKLFMVIAVTEMRPASALPPVFGLLVGIPGAFGCAVGNLVADYLSGYTPLLCLAGFAAQFIYGALPIFMWKMFNRQAPEAFRLHNVKNIIRYIVIIITDSAVIAVLLGLMMRAFNISPFFSTVTLMLFLNNLTFCMVLGIPVIIFATIKTSESGRPEISLNERFVLVFLLLGVVSASLIGIFAYTELSHSTIDPLAMWNRIFFYIAADLSIIYCITVLFLRYAENNIMLPVETITRIADNYINAGTEKRDSGSIIAECELLCRNRNETGTLAKAFQTMIIDLDTYIDNLTAITTEKERIGAELNVAATIQSSMLPCIFPAFPSRNEFDIYASMLPAKEVGGDFYDFFFVDDNTLAIVIADVSGKGVPASLFMVIAKTLLKNNAQSGKAPGEVFAAVNNMLCENNEAGMFVTAFMGYLSISSGRFTYVNAGHNAPLLRRRGGDFDWLPLDAGLPLAILEDMPYTQNEISLNYSDILYLYTDGVTEAANQKEELFTDQRLKSAVDRWDGGELKDLLSGIKSVIDDFADGAEQADDMTMLALKINDYIQSGVSVMKKLTVAATIENLQEVMNFIDVELINNGWPQDRRAEVAVVVEEIFVNIAHYAYGTGFGEASVRVSAGHMVLIEFEDAGFPYNPLKRPDPDITKGADEREVGGLGVYMAKLFMDRLEYRQEGGKNILTIQKTL